ncbi:hypothetical protein [Bosea sp. BIWAKO-01]|uniref:hypothetical protein n=1 Tax=Bosea sp. BIWAKO-01 TaxID=506668 RepID=UPI00086ECE7D|nr:hypothetical protein [Bosea sp. BIWAKO-01]GAU81202.1 hypothetical protein BIWAKO_01094 [Bosea sp. BIWAKO-01]
MKLVSVIAMTGLMALATAGAAEAQNQTFGRVVQGQPAPLQNAMTQSQARKACSQEMRGARESKASINQKMKNCVGQKMQGN